MAQLTILGLALYVGDSYAVPETDIDDSATSMQFDAKRCTSSDILTWPLAISTITFNLECSMDGGATWSPWNSPASGFGGIATSKGEEQTLMYLEGTIPSGSSRKVRGSIVLSAGIRTAATLTVL